MSRASALLYTAQDIYRYDRVFGFGLVDNHYFVIVVMIPERRIHVIDAMPTNAKSLEKVEKVSP